MATVAMIFGGMAGLVMALVALVLFNASWLLALALWSLGGAALALTLIGFALTARQPDADLIVEHA